MHPDTPRRALVRAEEATVIVFAVDHHGGRRTDDCRDVQSARNPRNGASGTPRDDRAWDYAVAGKRSGRFRIGRRVQVQCGISRGREVSHRGCIDDRVRYGAPDADDVLGTRCERRVWSGRRLCSPRGCLPAQLFSDLASRAAAAWQHPLDAAGTTARSPHEPRAITSKSRPGDFVPRNPLAPSLAGAHAPLRSGGARPWRA